MHINVHGNTDRNHFTDIKVLGHALMVTLLLTNVWIVRCEGRAIGQDKPANSQSEGADKDQPAIITGIVVNEKGIPLERQALELYMVVNGIARDAYGAPLRGAITIGQSRQALGLMMFPVKTETDAKGQFSMKLPKYVMVPGGVEMTAWTVVALDTSGKAGMLTSKGEMVTIVTKPDAPKIDVGKLTLTPQAPSEK